MSTMFDYPTGQVLEPSTSEWPCGQERYSASFLPDYEPLHPQWTCFPPISADHVGSSATWLDD